MRATDATVGGGVALGSVVSQLPAVGALDERVTNVSVNMTTEEREAS